MIWDLKCNKSSAYKKCLALFPTQFYYETEIKKKKKKDSVDIVSLVKFIQYLETLCIYCL